MSGVDANFKITVSDPKIVPINLVSIIFQPTNITADLGQDILFSVTATDALSYQWFKDGNALSGAINNILYITNARPAMIGDYFAVASNAAGSVTSSVAGLSIKGVDLGIWKGLVAYYPFNGNVKDESGNGNDGVSFNVSFAIDQRWIR